MAGKRILSEAESSNALELANKGGGLSVPFSSPAPMRGAVAKSDKINELENKKVDEFAARNPQLTQKEPAKLSKFGVGTPVALRHPQTGEITPMVDVEGRYHHPNTFTRISGHLDHFIPTTTGISKDAGHAKYGEPMIKPSMDETASDMHESQVAANLRTTRDQRFRMRTSGAPNAGRSYPGFGTVSGSPVGDPAGQARYVEEASQTPEYQTWRSHLASQPKPETWEAKPEASGNRFDQNTHLPHWLPTHGYQFTRMPKEEADRRALTASNNMASIHNIPRRAGESTYDHVTRSRGLITKAQNVAYRDYEEKRKADYRTEYGRDMPQPSQPGKSELNTDSVPHLGSVSETLYPVKPVPPKAPTKTLNIEGTDYMHPEEFQSRKAAGKTVPNYKLSSGGSSYVMEKTPVFNPKLDEDGNHIHNDAGVPQYTKSYNTAPKDYTPKAEMAPMVAIKGYKRPLSQREYDYVQANIKKPKSDKLNAVLNKAAAAEDKAYARDRDQRAKEKAAREAAFNKK
jgi:hypothetical protein